MDLEEIVKVLELRPNMLIQEKDIFFVTGKSYKDFEKLIDENEKNL